MFLNIPLDTLVFREGFVLSEFCELENSRKLTMKKHASLFKCISFAKIQKLASELALSSRVLKIVLLKLYIEK